MTKLEEAAARYREARNVALRADEKAEALHQKANHFYNAADAARVEVRVSARALEEAEVALREAAAEEL